MLNNYQDYTYVDHLYPTTSYFNNTAYQHIGYIVSGDGTHIARSFWQMSLSGLSGTTVAAATFNVYPAWSYSCTPESVSMYWTGPISSSTTWNNQPSTIAEEDSQSWAQQNPSFPGGNPNTTCPTTGNPIMFNATSAVEQSVEAAASNVTLGLYTNEANDLYWKQVNDGASLTVEYFHNPGTPTGLGVTPCGPGCTSPELTNATKPTLAAKAADSDGVNVNFNYQVYSGWSASPTTEVASGSVNNIAPNTTANWADTTALTSGSDYEYRAQACVNQDTSVCSAWSSYQEFQVDTTVPTNPSISSSTDPSQTAWYTSTTFDASWTTSDSVAIDGYSVVLNNTATAPTTTSVTQTGSTYADTTMTSGVWYLHVAAEDDAGNWSSYANYTVQIETSTPTWESPSSGTFNGVTSTSVTLTAGSGPTATGATFEALYKGAWQTIATATGGSGTWTATWAPTSMPDGPYLVAVQISYSAGPGQVTPGPVIWVDTNGPMFSGEMTGASNPSQPDLTAPTTAGMDPSSAATVDNSDGSLDLTVTDTSTPDPSSVPLALTRSYSSDDASIDSPFGYGWTDTYNMKATADSLYGSTAGPVEDIVQEDGSVVQFAEDATGKWVPLSQTDATLSYSSGQWTFTRDGQVSYLFNSSGQLINITDQAGYSTLLSYSGAELTTVTAFTEADYASLTNPTSITMTLAWGTCGTAQCVSSATDPGGRVIHYSYNTAGELSGVQDVAGNWTYYSYASSPTGYITAVEDPDGHMTDYSWSSAQVSTETDPANGQTTDFTLSGPSGQATVTTPAEPEMTDSLTDGQLTESNQSGLSPQEVVSYSAVTGGAASVTTGEQNTTNNPPGNPLPAEEETTSYTYNTSATNGSSIDDVATDTDGQGTTQSEYTAANQVWCSVDADDYANGTRCLSQQPTAPPAAGQPDQYTISGTVYSGLGMTLKFYNAAGLLTATTDPLGNTTTYSYTTVSSAPGPNLQYCSVDPADYRKGVTCPAYGAAHVTGTTTETYDTMGRKTSQTDPDGDTTTYSYSDSALPYSVTSSTDPDGTTTTYTYNSRGQATATTVSYRSYSAATLDAYDADGNEYCQISPLEAAQNETCPTSPPATPPTPGSDPFPWATITTYDADGRVVQTTTPLGGITLTAYDPNGNVYCTVAPAEAALGMTCPTSPPASPPTLGSDDYLGATINTYNTQNQLIQVTNPLGGVTLYNYDINGNKSQTTVESGSTSDPNIVTSYTYNSDNQILTTTVGSGSAAQVTTNVYDPNGNPYCTISPDADANGHDQCPTWNTAWITAPPSPTSLYSTNPTADQAENVTTTFQDADGDQVQTSNADGDTTVNAYDPDGRQYCTSDPTNVAAWLAANPTSAWPYLCPTSAPNTPPGPGSDPGYSATIYDQAGHTLSSTDQDGDTTSYTYTPGGQNLTTTDPRGETTTNCYYYENVGGQCASSAASGGGSGDDLYATTTPDTAADTGGETTSYTYYPGDLADTTTTPAGTTTDAYDTNGDLATVDYGGTANGYTTPANVSYTYNVDATKKTMVDATGTTTYTYDANGDITGQTLAATSGLSNTSVTYSYYPTGVLASTIYPAYGGYASPTATYNYDATGAMTSVADWLNDNINFSHDQDGNTTAQDNSDSQGSSSTTWTYDDADNNTEAASTTQTCDLTQSFSGTSGSRNADQQLIQYSETGSGTCLNQDAVQRDYSYDQAGRLVYQGSSPQAGNASNFAYDASGDPVTLSEHDSSGNYDTYTQTFDNAGEQTSQTPVSGSDGTTTTYTYDTLGDQLTADSSSGTTSYAYNQLAQMTTAAAPNGTASYRYNGQGLNAATTTSSGTAQYTWTTPSPLPLILSDSTSDYIYGPSDQPVEQISLVSSTPTYLTYTQADDTWLTTNQAGDETGYWGYDAYGNLAFGTPTSPFGYSGQATDSTTGLVNDRARWYGPQTGGFSTRDPLFASTDMAYIYANDDPVNQSDPTGESADKCNTTGYQQCIDVQGTNLQVTKWTSTAMQPTDTCASPKIYFQSKPPFKSIFANVFTTDYDGIHCVENGHVAWWNAYYPYVPVSFVNNTLLRVIWNFGWGNIITQTVTVYCKSPNEEPRCTK